MKYLLRKCARIVSETRGDNTLASMKTFLIILLPVLALGIVGGSYYYFEIYQPENAARVILAEYKKIELLGFKPDTSRLKDERDFAMGEEALTERTRALNAMGESVDALQIIKRLEHVREDMRSFVSLSLSLHNNALEAVRFYRHAAAIQEAFAAMQGEGADQNVSPKTIGDFQNLWNGNARTIQREAEELFRVEYTRLAEPSFSELKASWEKAGAGLDFLMDLLNSLDPAASLQNATSLFSASQSSKLEKSGKDMEAFTELLDSALEGMNAYDILMFRDSSIISQTELAERIFALIMTMRELEQRYP